MRTYDRLEAYQALCFLPPAAFQVMAELIMSVAEKKGYRQPRRNRRARRTGNIDRPVVTIDRDSREGRK